MSPTTGVISSPIYDASASAAALEAAETIDDIEGAGFRVNGLLGTGAFGSVYSAEVVSRNGWADSGMFSEISESILERKFHDGLLPHDDAIVFARDGHVKIPRLLQGTKVAIKRMTKTRFALDREKVEAVSVQPGGKSSFDDMILGEGIGLADIAFRHEVVALRAARSSGNGHGNIGNILGTFESDSAHYIVLELVEGLPLFDWIVEHGIFFRESTASAALKQILEALAHIHARHICHNDIKPENILVAKADVKQRRAGRIHEYNPDDADGLVLETMQRDTFSASGSITMSSSQRERESELKEHHERNDESTSANVGTLSEGDSKLVLKLIDFGMAHILSGKGQNAKDEEGVMLVEADKESPDKGGSILSNNSSLHSTIEGGPHEGTFAYWAPEMMCGERYGVAVDMWSLGVTLYISLCGEHPFDPKGVSISTATMQLPVFVLVRSFPFSFIDLV